MPSSENLSSSRPELLEKCGVFGASTPGQDAIEPTLIGTQALQHRGQDGAGIVSLNNGEFLDRRNGGLVSEIFDEQVFSPAELPGKTVVSHTRYGTSNKSTKKDAHIQPVLSEERRLAFSHNGNLPITRALDEFMVENIIPNRDFNDTEKMHAVTEYFLMKGATLEEAMREVVTLFTGTFSLVMADSKTGLLAAFRDQRGIRPLSIGRNDKGYAFASETIALEESGFDYVRDVNPGELVQFDGTHLTSTQIMDGELKRDLFEDVYFSRPESHHLGHNVGESRREMGRQAARAMLHTSSQIDADVVIGVPRSGLLAAEGFAETSGLPLAQGLTIREGYKKGRTFITPDGVNKKNAVRNKLEAHTEIVGNKRVVVVEDSIVRGNTLRAVIEMLREAGADEVHALSASPHVYYPDFYGINTPRWNELIANRHATIEGLAEEIGADSVHFNSVKDTVKATGQPMESFSTAAFTGEYPVDIGERRLELGQPTYLELHSKPQKLVTSRF